MDLRDLLIKNFRFKLILTKSFIYIHFMKGLSQMESVSLDKDQIVLDPEDILRLLGEQAESVDAHTKRLIDRYIEESIRISSPKGAYVLTDSSEARSREEIATPTLVFNSGKIIPKMLKHSENYAFFLLTLGAGPEELARSLMAEGDYLEGYIVDLAASALVDSFADQIQEQIRIRAKNRGWLITNRYSPGYCSWRVEEQQKLFSLFPENCCGISLSESSLMNPVKSISGIIGLGAKVSYQEYTCDICSMKNCHFRKKRPS